jgi:hypothetical protein
MQADIGGYTLTDYKGASAILAGKKDVTILRKYSSID